MSADSRSPHDNLFAEPLSDPGLFTFNESVATVFPDMINRSVPGYATVIAMTGVLAAQHACLLYTSPSPRDGLLSRMPSSA